MDDVQIADHAPPTEAERGWIDILRAIFPGGVPAPDLQRVQALRRAFSERR